MLNALTFFCFALFLYGFYSVSKTASLPFLIISDVVPVSVDDNEDTNHSEPTVLKLKSSVVPICNKDGEYRFEEQLGTYYDLFEITHHYPVKSEFIVVGQSKPIILSVLNEETDWSATQPIDRGPEWEDRNSLIIKHYQKRWLQSETNRVIVPPNHRDSYFTLNTFPGMNAPFIVGENMCFNRSTQNWIYFSNQSYWNRNETTNNWFRWGWNIERQSTYPPKEKFIFINESVWVSQPCLPRHITHFSESVNQILIKFQYPYFYPKLNTIFLTRFDNHTEYEWTREYLRLVLSHIPESQQPVVYTKDSNPFIPKKSTIKYICFRNVVLIDRLAYNKDGGVFGGFFSQDLMRSRAYKYAGISGKRKSFENGVPVMFLDRRDGRRFRKVNKYLNNIKKYFGNKVNLFHTNLTKLSFKRQIELFSSYPIVIGGHGSAMANMMFAIPHSVLIECNPPYFYEMCFANIAFISRVHYISITNYNNAHVSRKYRNDAALAYERGEFFNIRRKYAFLPIYPSVFHVIASIDDALEYVKRYDYAYQVNDFWSYVYN